MSISDNYAPLKALGNGVTTDFSDTWDGISSSFFRVFLKNVITGVLTEVDQGGAADEYTVSFDDSGFIVTFGTAPTSDNYVIVSREVSIDQSAPYKTSKGFQGETLEDSLDKLTAIDQDQQDEISRSLKFSLGSSAIGLLPAPVDDTPIGWDGTTGSIKNGSKTLTEINNAVDAVAALSSGSGVLVSANDAAVGFLNGKLVAGDVITFTENNDGGNESLTLSIPDGSITNAKLADVATATIKGRVTSGTGEPEDLTATQARTVIDVYSKSEVDTAISSVGIKEGTAQDTTSGSSKSFSIDAGAKRVTIQYVGVSLSSGDSHLIQLGDSGGIETSGYLGSSSQIAASVGSSSYTNGFGIRTTSSAFVIHGTVVLTRQDASSNTWVASGMLGDSNSARNYSVGGSKSLSDELTTIKTLIDGAGSYDTGSINVSWE